MSNNYSAIGLGYLDAQGVQDTNVLTITNEAEFATTDLTKYTILHINSCNLTTIPTLPNNIKSLHCTDNNISRIPPSTELIEINCRRNPLLRFRFEDFPNLKYIQIDQEQLLNSDLVTYPENILINNNTEFTMRNLTNYIRDRLDFVKYIRKWKAIQYQPGGELANQIEQEFYGWRT